MSFWEKTVTSQNATITPEMLTDSNNITLDEDAVAELQEDPNVDIFDEEEEDTQAIMADANLRLEQGRLYQMVLQSNIFADTDADPRAIRNVHREIRKLAREKMEVMLGIRQEQAVKETIVSSPFNDLEVTVLKMLASKMSKGATEESAKPTVGPQASPPVPKKDGITAISGNLRPQTTPLNAKPKASTPLSATPKTPLKPQSKAQKPAPTSAINKEEDTLLTKPVTEMTPQELVEYEKAAAERRAKNKSALPTNLLPHPSPQQLELMYAASANQLSIANPWRVSKSE